MLHHKTLFVVCSNLSRILSLQARLNTQIPGRALHHRIVKLSSNSMMCGVVYSDTTLVTGDNPAHTKLSHCVYTGSSQVDTNYRVKGGGQGTYMKAWVFFPITLPWSYPHIEPHWIGAIQSANNDSHMSINTWQICNKSSKLSNTLQDISQQKPW